MNRIVDKELIEKSVDLARDIEGHLTERDMRFLALMASSSTAEGVILEIGSFKGKSATLLAKAAESLDGAQVVAVDPLTSPSETDPDLQGKSSGEEDFLSNLKKANVQNMVEFHKAYSYELATNWDRPIRMLWIDGDHTYEGAKKDFDLFSGYLSDGAIIAFHDTFDFDGPFRVFMEDILLNPNFGPAGLCGGISWAQYTVNPSIGFAYREKKLRLYNKLTKLVQFLCLDPSQGKYVHRGWERVKYNYYRAMVPHKEPSPEQWTSQLVDTADY